MILNVLSAGSTKKIQDSDFVVYSPLEAVPKRNKNLHLILDLHFVGLKMRTYALHVYKRSDKCFQSYDLHHKVLYCLEVWLCLYVVWSLLGTSLGSYDHHQLLYCLEVWLCLYVMWFPLGRDLKCYDLHQVLYCLEVWLCLYVMWSPLGVGLGCYDHHQVLYCLEVWSCFYVMWSPLGTGLGCYDHHQVLYCLEVWLCFMLRDPLWEQV